MISQSAFHVFTSKIHYFRPRFEEFLEEVRPELKSTDPNAGKVYSLSDRKLHKGDREAKGCIFNLPHFKGGG